jgi:hypothetical protein
MFSEWFRLQFQRLMFYIVCFLSPSKSVRTRLALLSFLLHNFLSDFLPYLSQIPNIFPSIAFLDILKLCSSSEYDL